LLWCFLSLLKLYWIFWFSVQGEFFEMICGDWIALSRGMFGGDSPAHLKTLEELDLRRVYTKKKAGLQGWPMDGDFDASRDS